MCCDVTVTTKMEKVEYRSIIKYFFFKGLKPKAIFKDMVENLGESAPSYATVKHWVAEFKRGRMNIEDAERSGRPSTAVVPHKIDFIQDLVMDNRLLTVQEIADEVGISRERVGEILHSHLGLSKVSARWVPHVLTPDQKLQRLQLSSEGLTLFQKDTDSFLERFVTVDETWIHHYRPSSKKLSKKSEQTMSPPPKKARSTSSVIKVMITVFWDSKGVLLVDFLDKGKIMNGAYYAALLTKLKESIETIRTGMLTRGVLLHQGNSPAQKSAEAIAEIQQCNFEILDLPPYSPDLAPSDYHLFPQLKKQLVGKEFSTDDEFKESVNAFFNSCESTFFRSGIEELISRWYKCVNSKGDYI